MEELTKIEEFIRKTEISDTKLIAIICLGLTRACELDLEVKNKKRFNKDFELLFIANSLLSDGDLGTDILLNIMKMRVNDND